MKTAFLFPGQGAQFVGMGKELAEGFPQAKELFARANDIVGYDLAQLCFDGPEDKLNATTVSQPAIFTVSAALLDILNASPNSVQPDVTAGLSLGEYTALYAAGLISFEDGLRLVQKRGDAMQTAADDSDGSMVSVLGLDEVLVISLCEEASQGELLVAVNFNCPKQIVLSGSTGACRRAADLAEKYGAIKAIPLSVAGAFHSEMMNPAAEELEKALASCPIKDPAEMKVIANINSEYYNDANTIRNGLVKQLIQPILWQKCMEKLLAEGVESFYEIGPGRVLTGLMKRINRRTKVTNISTAESLQKFLDSVE
ncbi:MAG: [acyl-carrier-protein] S-malonyltransferase [Planctomycetota bacterium]|nr:MAG: [acyl-carrier-protein] S-malonyltransferase [Planctomycetota bacterium]